MRVLLHTQWGLKENFVGGTERFVINLAKGIKKRGDEAFVVCSNLEDLILVEGVQVYGMVPLKYRDKIMKYGYANEHFFKNEIIGHKIDFNSISLFSSYVWAQLHEFNFDIAHLNSFLCCSLFPNNNILSKMIATNHENDLELDHYWGNKSFLTLTELVKHNTSLKKLKERIVPSKYYSKMFTNLWDMPVISIPLGVDIDHLDKFSRNEELRREYASDEGIVILLPSRFDIQQKGHDIAVKALSILKKKGVKFRCIFSGFDRDTYGVNFENFKQLVKEYDVEKEITLTRFDNMLDAYGVCDIVISPERFCSYGLAISESLALGLPTILTPIPTYLEIASNYDHAYFTIDHSPEELTNRILEIINSHLGINYLEAQRFRENNSFKKCVDKYYLIYRS